MNRIETEPSVAESVAFLSSRVAEQARKDSVALTNIELEQLSFSEETATPEQIAAAHTFDETHESDEFEAKISKLLRRVFRDDVQHGMRPIWEKHLAALRDHDVYVLVMVDEAGIRRPKPIVRVKAEQLISPIDVARRSPDILAGLITAFGFVYFFLLRIGSSRRTGPTTLGDFADHLIPSENLRGIFLLAWLGSMLWLWVRFRD